MARSSIDVLARVEAVADAQDRGGPRHELHEPPRALSGHRSRIEARFRADDCPDEVGRHGVPVSRLPDVPRIGAMIAARFPPRGSHERDVPIPTRSRDGRDVDRTVLDSTVVCLGVDGRRDDDDRAHRKEDRVATHAPPAGQIRYRIKKLTNLLSYEPCRACPW